jgi:putative ABC transport system substrate-binding protein
MRRREFIAFVGGAAIAWPLAAPAEQPTLPVVAVVNGGSPEDSARLAGAFGKGLNEAGFTEGQNVSVEYHWVGGNTIRCQHYYRT